MSRLPTGVTIVAVLAGGAPVGATANAVTSLSLAPPLFLVSLDRGSRTLGALAEAGRFGVSVLRAEHAELARSFATKAPHTEKWRQVAWSERHGAPILDGALAWVACELAERHEAGDHIILIGSILAAGSAEGDPLVFHDGAYRGLEHPG